MNAYLSADIIFDICRLLYAILDFWGCLWYIFLCFMLRHNDLANVFFGKEYCCEKNDAADRSDYSL